MKLVQVPFAKAVSTRGVVFYHATSVLMPRALFGEKGFDASRMVLRGVVITGRENGVQQGMALIEIDGKPADAVSIGEMVPPGIRLEKIEPGSAVVSYQGREFILQQ